MLASNQKPLKEPVKQDPFKEAASGLPPVVPAAQAAEFLGVDRRTLGRWCASGKAEFLRTSPSGSGRLLILRSELVRLLREMAKGTA